VAVTIDKISPIPAGIHARREVSRRRNRVKRQRIMEILMDEAYPFLHERLLKETGVCLEIGKGSLVML
jgi:hypothetical protein